ncbi:triose-phosphate isomerase [Patescibacteria group bacterium]
MKYVIGNWKSNLNITETKNWIKTVKKSLSENSENLKIILCPGYTHLPIFKSDLKDLALGAQTISSFPDGAYTGQVSARTLKDYIEYVIVGHSERRTYLKETDNTINNQVTQAIESSITPIIAVDKKNWHSQLSIINSQQLSQSLVMYEPPEAISQQVGPVGKGSAAPIKEVVEMIKKIKSEFSFKASIYGGSIKSDNIKEFLSQEEIDGVLPGSASINPDEWVKMITIAAKIS